MEQEPKIGAIVLSTEQGLGYLAKAFYDNGVIDIVYVHKHGSRKNNYDWFPDRVDSLDILLEKIDVLLMFETPFDWTIIPKARKKGIKTVLIPMYECTNYPFPYEPDKILCPSELDYEFYTKKGKENCEIIQIPVDVNWKLRQNADVFVHNAGNGGLGGRNGTKELLEAIRYVKSPIKLIVRSQVPIKEVNDPRIEYRIGNFTDIWDEGDVFVFPEKFNGLSLPIQEAFASGMLVMASDRFPNNKYLPKDPLIKVERYTKEFISVEFDMAVINSKDIAQKIDEWYNKNITEYSLLGLEYNKKNVWSNLKEKLKTQIQQ